MKDEKIKNFYLKFIMEKNEVFAKAIKIDFLCYAILLFEYEIFEIYYSDVISNNLNRSVMNSKFKYF